MKGTEQRFWNNLGIAFEAIKVNAMRSALTALGIIFGVAAVIAMLAIGNGAQQEILEQIKLVGVNNIVINSVVEDPDETQNSEDENAVSQIQKRFSKGLDLADATQILSVVPGVKLVSPEVVYKTIAINQGLKRDVSLIGIRNDFFAVYDHKFESGNEFSEFQLNNSSPVCVIGAGIAKIFFTEGKPIGSYLKVGNHWLKVVGVLSQKASNVTNDEALGIRNNNLDIYTPINTLLVRYQNRKINKAGGGGEMFGGDDFMVMTSGKQNKPANPHQIDKLVVQMEESELLTPASKLISRMLMRTHNEVEDFGIVIPEHLLAQQQKTKDIFNIVLGAIAGISLLVGGIGIMNIMLASVLERTREIGVRQALGATKKDIVHQFMFEAVLISISGGLIGIILGVVLSFLISTFADIQTIISPTSVVVSFIVSAGIGLIFGIAPAKNASEKDPIQSLRYE